LHISTAAPQQYKPTENQNKAPMTCQCELVFELGIVESPVESNSVLY